MDSITPEYKLKIIIDTSYDFHSNGTIYERIEPKISSEDRLKYGTNELEIPSVKKYLNRIEFLKNKYVAVLPVLIYNNSDKNALVSKGSYGDFIMIQEAKDIDGKWKPIEFRYWMQSCVPGSFDFVLYPKKYLATSIIKYHGKFKTKIRVKFLSRKKIYYSNEVTEFINRYQFNQEFCRDFLKNRTPWFSEEYFESDKDFMFLNFEKYFPKNKRPTSFIQLPTISHKHFQTNGISFSFHPDDFFKRCTSF